MSADEGGPLRSVSTNRGFKPEASMNAIGYLIAVLMVPVLLPLAPFLLAAWLLRRSSGE